MLLSLTALKVHPPEVDGDCGQMFSSLLELPTSPAGDRVLDPSPQLTHAVLEIRGDRNPGGYARKKLGIIEVIGPECEALWDSPGRNCHQKELWFDQRGIRALLKLSMNRKGILLTRLHGVDGKDRAICRHVSLRLPKGKISIKGVASAVEEIRPMRVSRSTRVAQRNAAKRSSHMVPAGIERTFMLSKA
jgi:hypothetical protein